MNNYQRRDMGFWYHQEYDPTRNGSMDGTDIAPHDHGLVRAHQSRYNSTKDINIQSEPYKTLFVSRLKLTTTEETLERSFSKYGKVKSAKLVRDLITGSSKGYGFVEYVHDEDLTSAFFGAHRQFIDEQQILVDFMREQTVPGWVPRRCGGGIGGKKQSGQMRFGGRDCPFRAPFDISIYQKRQQKPSGEYPVRREEERRDGRREESRREEGRREESRREGGRREEGMREEGRREESRREGGKREEGMREEGRREESRKEGGRREEVMKDRTNQSNRTEHNSANDQHSKYEDKRHHSRHHHRHSRSRSRNSHRH